MDFNNYKFRPSSVGRLMVSVKPALTEKQKETLEGLLAKPNRTEKQSILMGQLLEKKNAKPTLSKGAQSYLKEIYQEQIFGRSKNIRTKYMDKGIQAEERSLNLYSEVTGEFLVKNETTFENEILRGTPDVVDEKIIDIKTSWDFASFPLHDEKIENNVYEWQLISYMLLTGLTESELVYCLISTPMNIIKDELRRLDWKFDIMDMNGNVRIERKDIVIESLSNMIYTVDDLKLMCADLDVPIEWFEGSFKEVLPEQRIKVFPLDLDQAKVRQLKLHISMAREFMNNLSIQMLKVA